MARQGTGQERTRGRWPGAARRSLAPVAVLGSAALVAVGFSPVASASPAPPTCAAASPGGPIFVTGDCVDPELNQPYTDIDQPGSITDPTTGVTVSYRYIHGGFTGTNAKFAFYFPAGSQYKGRFFETTYPTLSNENVVPDCASVGTSACAVAFALSHGAYVVSSNNAGGVPAGGALAPYRANAVAAKYSRTVAAQVYGTSARPRGYLYGASGGAYQTVGAMENTSGVWDGAVPMVFGVPNAIPSFQASQALALRVLASKLPQIADAMEPGGSGNPYQGLNAEQRGVLREVTRLGFPLRGWWQYATLNGGAFLAVAPVVRILDPTYVTDFWSQPGYEGSEPSVAAARIQHDATVQSVNGNSITLDSVPTADIVNSDLVITSGPLNGQTTQIASVSGNTIQVTNNPGITPGTTVRIDNSWLLALEYYQRHQVPTPDQYGWNQYRAKDGTPLEPQRSLLTGPILAASTAGSVPSGHFYGKMIMLGSTMDVQAYPWSEDWYRKQAKADQGNKLNSNYRLWFMDNADHDPNGPAATSNPLAASHIVSYAGEMEQALLDLDAWVSKGTPPPASTRYTVTNNDAISVAPTAAQRKGLQPVLHLSASRASGGPVNAGRIDIAAGKPVTFSLSASVPPGAGKIVQADWNFKGIGNPTAQSTLARPAASLRMQATFTYYQKGTYFPYVTVASQRNGNGGTPYTLVQNLIRIRVVVH
jgi:hypothetical protein